MSHCGRTVRLLFVLRVSANPGLQLSACLPCRVSTTAGAGAQHYQASWQRDVDDYLLTLGAAGQREATILLREG
ncbi:hypothetical protein A5764_07940 [Mycobacterium sp. 852002-51057_SCH5723018]|nr:hypothetical protein A5764_07940 [Mycobacterium sp. 852002-51057_SCH5723018]